MNCPNCESPFSIDAMRDLPGFPPPEDTLPTPGDALICLECGQVVVIDETGQNMRRPTPDEEDQLREDPVFAVVLDGVFHVRHPNVFDAVNAVTEDSE